MLLVTLRDLQHRARRVLVVTLLVGLVLTLLFLMTGLVNQLNTESSRAVDEVGASHWVVAEGVSGPFTSASVLPAEPPTDGLAPLVVARGTLLLDDGDTEIVVIGHERGALGDPRVVEGRLASSADEVVVDETLDLPLGASVGVGGEQYEVVGLSRDTTVLAGLPFVFMGLERAQQLAFTSDAVVSAYLGDEDPGAVEGGVVLTATEVAEDALGPLESAISSIDLIRVLLWTVAAIVIGAVVFLSALERQRDFAVMKAVGASTRSVGMGLAVQAVLMALLGAVVAAALATVAEPVFPLAVRVPDAAYVQVPVGAAVVGLLAALFGVRRVGRIDPADAFAGAGR